jgi:hypothetical protein
LRVPLACLDSQENSLSIAPEATIDLTDGTARFKNVNNCLNTNIYSYLETSGGQSSNPHLNVVHFLNTRAD